MHELVIILQKRKDLAILIVASGEKVQTVFFHDTTGFNDREEVTSKPVILSLSRTGRMSNISTYNMVRAFTNSRNTHLSTVKFLIKNMVESNILVIPLSGRDVMIASTTCSLLPPG